MRALLFPARTALAGCLALVLLLTGCIDPYNPPAISSTVKYLVVDGYLNSNGITTIYLSRTYAIGAATAPPKETRATVYLEEEAGPRYTLRETSAGTYTSDKLVLNPAKKYRLHLTTLAKKEYASDFVPAQITPPIDAITWQANADGLNIYVNTHDPKNATHYYRWAFEETWEISPIVIPVLEYTNHTVRPIVTPYPRTCWISDAPGAIKLSKTTSLSQDIVSEYLLRSYPATTERLRHKYSILVKQYAQTKEEYFYWDLLKKNTENIGSLFDPLPSQLLGNVHCLNDNTELALGYVGAHTLEEKRLFISRPELPGSWHLQSSYESCLPLDTVEIPNEESAFLTGSRVPVNVVSIKGGGGIRGYTTSIPDCVDCRTRGTAVRPAFWQ